MYTHSFGLYSRCLFCRQTVGNWTHILFLCFFTISCSSASCFQLFLFFFFCVFQVLRSVLVCILFFCCLSSSFCHLYIFVCYRPHKLYYMVFFVFRNLHFAAFLWFAGQIYSPQNGMIFKICFN